MSSLKSVLFGVKISPETMVETELVPLWVKLSLAENDTII